MTTPEQENVEETNNTLPTANADDLAPIIPGWVLLMVAGIGLFMLVGAFIVTGGLNIFGWAGIAVTVISLVLWAVLFPEEVLDLIRGRTLTYGGVGIGVTVGVIVASGLIYSLIAEQGWNRDFSERDIFSLDSQVSDVLNAMADDPSIPTVEIIGFFNTTSASQRDRVEILLQDMVSASDGKIVDYTFIDPAVQPQLTESYVGEDAFLPAIVVAEIDPATGEPSTTEFEVAQSTGQFQIINALLSLSVEGDFRAYFLAVEGGVDINDSSESGGDGIVGDLEGEWTVESINPLLLTSPSPPVLLNDPNASAEVIIIPGGTQALPDNVIAILRTYVENGGDLIVMGDVNTEGGVTTAQAENFDTFLFETFGVRLRNDIVIDPTNPIRNLGRTFVVDNYSTHPIVSTLEEDDLLVFSSPHSIEIADTPPTGVTITPLISTSADGYAKAGVDFSRDLTEEELALDSATDLTGELPLAVAAENANTGSRLVLISSEDLMLNEWRQFREVEAPETMESAILWASDARNFSDEVRTLNPEPNTADLPIFLTQEDVGWMGFISLFLLPFGMLGIGIVVWWLR
ncbi:MAG: Gldg family protein, partial [Chloroflexota bacterium]